MAADMQNQSVRDVGNPQGGEQDSSFSGFSMPARNFSLTAGGGAGATQVAQRQARSPEEEVLDQVRQYDHQIAVASQRFGISMEQIRAIIAVESNGNPDASSGAAFGLMQVTSQTWTDTLDNFPELRQYSFSQWRQILPNIMVGTASFLLKTQRVGVTGDNPNFARIAIAAYNAGEGTIGEAMRLAEADGHEDSSAVCLQPEYLKPAISWAGIYVYYLTGGGRGRNRSGTVDEAVGLKYQEISQYPEKITGYLALQGVGANGGSVNPAGNGNTTPIASGSITGDELNVRGGPGTWFRAEGNQLSRGTSVQIFEVDGNWVRIGDRRWIHGDYVDVSSVSNSGQGAPQAQEPSLTDRAGDALNGLGNFLQNVNPFGQRDNGQQQSQPRQAPAAPVSANGGIAASVGAGGTNLEADVRKVQQALSRVGYPVTIDGVNGPETEGAIHQYQRSIFNGWSDGLVEPGEKTFASLNQGSRGSTPANTGDSAPPSSVVSNAGSALAEFGRSILGSGSSASSPSPPFVIRASVGSGGENSPEDVRTIQLGLRYAGYSLSVDGAIGSETLGTIQSFQQTVFDGWSDGRIDPDGNTLTRLNSVRQGAMANRQETQPSQPEQSEGGGFFDWAGDRLSQLGGLFSGNGRQQENDQGGSSGGDTDEGQRQQGSQPATQSGTNRGVTISASVGSGGVNNSSDVLKVQQMLSDIGYNISVDGQLGGGIETLGAIHAFQFEMTGSSDGRVDPGGNTLGLLNTVPTGTFSNTLEQLQSDSSAPQLTNGNWTQRTKLIHDSAGNTLPPPLYDNMSRLISMMDKISERLPRGLNVNSGYRSPKYNAAIAHLGAVENSNHQMGQAVDISSTHYSANTIYSAIMDLIAEGQIHDGGVGLYSTFVHYDVGHRSRW